MRRRPLALLALSFAVPGAVLAALLLRDTGLDANACRELDYYTSRQAEECIALDPNLETHIYGVSTEPAATDTGDVAEPDPNAADESEVVLRIVLQASGRHVGTAIVSTATQEFRETSGLLDYDGLLLEIDPDSLDPSDWRSDAQVVIRPGTCKRVVPGAAYRIGGWPTVPGLAGEWVVDVYRMPGAVRPTACGAHRAPPGSQTSLGDPQPVVRDGTARRTNDGSLTMPLGAGRAVLRPVSNGRRTEVFLMHESLADYTDLPAHLRAGTCSRYTSTHLIPLEPLVPDDEAHEDTGVSEWAYSTTEVELPFETVARGPYAVEVHDRDAAEFSGAGIESCAEIGG